MMVPLQLEQTVFTGRLLGNRHRIRFLRGRTQKFAINLGSKTTRRIKSEAGLNIAHPLVREHRTIACPYIPIPLPSQN